MINIESLYFLWNASMKLYIPYRINAHQILKAKFIMESYQLYLKNLCDGFYFFLSLFLSCHPLFCP